MQRAAIVAISAIAIGTATPAAHGQSLRGSPQAMKSQHSIAQQHDYTFLRTSADIRRFVDAGYLVHLPGNSDYGLAAVSYPYARPAMKLFVERLANQYRSACGEKLVVTSLTRPTSNQPRNASPLSVHPAGMALDLRVSRNSACRRWLESTLLSLEKQGVLDATRENYPPHYHVALFPTNYTKYVARLTNGRSSVQLASTTSAPKATPSPTMPVDVTPAPAAVAIAARNGPSAEEPVAVAAENAVESGQQYRVNRGDSLWSIARRHGTTVDTLKQLNGLRDATLIAGQVIAVPVVATGADSDVRF